MRSQWRLRLAALVAGVALLVAPACTAETSSGAAAPTVPGVRSADPDVVDFTGLAGMSIGASLTDLEAAGVVARAASACGQVEYVDRTQVRPIFDAGRLVLIWVDPPLHTPEGVQVGTALAAARSTYPDAVELTRPDGSGQFPGLLITAGDRAYLLLHDGEQVQKLIVGTERHARLLFDAGFGTC